MKRRDFLSGVAVTSASLVAGARATASPLNENPQAKPATTGGRPKNIMISAANGITSRGNHLEAGYQKLIAGADTLEAAITTVSGPENDPKDTSVGLGGLPNEEGVVELDACCMHGPTRRAGSVGGVRDIKNVAAVSRAVMEHTGHVMLVGEGATRFAVAMGFPKENLLTDDTRKIWMLWKEYHSDQDWWGPGLADPRWKAPPAEPESRSLQPHPPQGEPIEAVRVWGSQSDVQPFDVQRLEAQLKSQPQRIQRLYAAAADLGIP